MATDQNQIDLIRKDLTKYGDIDAIANQKGGEILIQSLVTDALNSMYRLGAGYKTLSHIEMIALCASFAEKVDILHALTRAERNKEGAKDRLEGALKE